jgi:predicted nucleic acid-binding protein
MRFLLDTNICIYVIKQKQIPLLQRFQTHSPSDIRISAITIGDLGTGDVGVDGWIGKDEASVRSVGRSNFSGLGYVLIMAF